jgi:hypothetical protein
MVILFNNNNIMIIMDKVIIDKNRENYNEKLFLVNPYFFCVYSRGVGPRVY